MTVSTVIRSSTMRSLVVLSVPKRPSDSLIARRFAHHRPVPVQLSLLLQLTQQSFQHPTQQWSSHHHSQNHNNDIFTNHRQRHFTTLPSHTKGPKTENHEHETLANSPTNDSIPMNNDDITDIPQSLPPYPTIAMAKAMPLAYRQMDNITLTTVAGMGQHAAREQVLIRHIMATDNLPYPQALQVFHTIRQAHLRGTMWLGIPFHISALAMLVGGVASVPLVFDLTTVEYFNQVYVTADVPPQKDLETWLEVGSWSWNWMEPVLGTGTFLLLCLQYFR